MKYLVINGPNLNLLGKRDPNIYGVETLEEIELWIASHPEIDGIHLEWYQSNHEGEIIDKIHYAMNSIDGIIINPGAFTHYSYAIRDAIEAVSLPTVEVHLSNILKRESFRNISVIKDVCEKQISGKGKMGYLEAIKFLIHSKKDN